MERFYVANSTGVPVHVRLDAMEDSARIFRLTLSSSEIRGGRPLANFVLVTKLPRHLPHLDGRLTKFSLDDRMFVQYDNYKDDAGDYIFRITGFLN